MKSLCHLHYVEPVQPPGQCCTSHLEILRCVALQFLLQETSLHAKICGLNYMFFSICRLIRVAYLNQIARDSTKSTASSKTPTDSHFPATLDVSCARISTKREQQTTINHVDYFGTRTEEDHFSEPSLLDPIDSVTHSDIITAGSDMVQQTIENGLPIDLHNCLETIFNEKINVFHATFSPGPAVKFPKLNFDLTLEARPCRRRLQNYSREQLAFLYDFVRKLAENDMAYSNPTLKSACTPLLVPEIGARCWFTVNLCPGNNSTMQHGCFMLNIDRNRSKLKKSTVFTNFDLPTGSSWFTPTRKSVNPSSHQMASFCQRESYMALLMQ